MIKKTTTTFELNTEVTREVYSTSGIDCDKCMTTSSTRQGGGSDAPLGRVFVEDPDDWDLEDKEFEWAGPPHPLFTLQPRDGTIMASSSLREGR